MKKYRIKAITSSVNQVIKKYKYNQLYIKKYGDEVIKVIVLKTVRNKEYKEEIRSRAKKGSKNKHKKGCNVRRAKARVQELALCNEWKWFSTLTIDNKKYDRKDLKQWYKELTQWIRNYNKKYGLKIKYLLVPEMHSDGVNWHMHGMIMGLPEEHLNRIQRGDKAGKRQLEKVEMGERIYTWAAYEKKFGFCNFEPIKNKVAVSRYISKSIDLSITTGVTEVNAHMYYSSKGLEGAETIKVGTLHRELWREEDYGNEYCKVFWEQYDEKVINQIVASIDDD